MCVYTASFSQVLYDPWDYSRMGSGHTHTHTSPPPPKERRADSGGEEAGGRDNRSEGRRKKVKSVCECVRECGAVGSQTDSRTEDLLDPLWTWTPS